MDYVRSGYIRKARLTGGCGLEKIRWFYASPTAAVFPTWHSFGSLNYVDDPAPLEPDQIGEAFKKQERYSKSPGHGQIGHDFRGPLAAFQEGLQEVDCPQPNTCCKGVNIPDTLYASFRTNWNSPQYADKIATITVTSPVNPKTWFGTVPGSSPTDIVVMNCEELPYQTLPQGFSAYMGLAPNPGNPATDDSKCKPLRLLFNIPSAENLTLVITDTIPTNPYISFDDIDTEERSVWCRAAKLVSFIRSDAPDACTTIVKEWLGQGTITYYRANSSTLPPGVFMAWNGRVAVVAISGTTNVSQWFNQLTQASSPMVDYGDFSTIAVWKGAADVILGELQILCGTLDVDVILIGHSMGGAISCIAAGLHEVSNPSNKRAVITFGAPKPGDIRLKNLLSSIKVSRLVNDGDFIGLVPPDVVSSAIFTSVLTAGSIYFWHQFLHPSDRISVALDGQVSLHQPEPWLPLDLMTVALAYVAGIPPGNPFSHLEREYRRTVCPRNAEQ